MRDGKWKLVANGEESAWAKRSNVLPMNPNKKKPKPPKKNKEKNTKKKKEEKQKIK